MNIFEKALDEAYDDLYQIDEEILDILEGAFDEDEYHLIQEELGLCDEDQATIVEALKRRVTSTGAVSKVRSAGVRKRRASITTKMSRAALKMRGRKAAKTRKKNPASMKRAKKKRAKAMRRRKQMGIK